MDMTSETRSAQGAGLATDKHMLGAAIVSTDDVQVDDEALQDKVIGATEEVDTLSKPALYLHPRSRAGFLHFYGWLGVPMVVIFAMSSSWTMMLAVTQQIPTQVANYLMDTADLDFGDFWLLPRADSAISVPATVTLVLFSLGYLSLVGLMIFPDKLALRSDLAPVVPATPSQNPAADKASRLSKTIPKGLTWLRIRYEIMSPYGLLSHYYNPLLDLPKLVFQTSTMFTYLQQGFPLPIIFIYSCLLFINWMISSYRYMGERRDPQLVLCRLFYSFDLFFAVFAPLEVLIYARYSFHFDRDAFMTRFESLAPGNFDRTARLYADPTEISLYRIAFHYLQLTTVSSLLIKCGLNALSLIKWRKSILQLAVLAKSNGVARVSVVGSSLAAQANAAKQRRRAFRQRLLISSGFFVAGVVLFTHSIIDVVSTQRVCEPYKQCKIPSYQWNVGSSHCSCIVFVDRDTRLTTMAEWEDPPNVTENLAALAHTGHLKIVQIVNRQLPVFPEELRKCHDLEQLILIYTKTLALPDWASDFKKLEYLHIEGDLTAKALTYMPSDLFVHMTHLMFLHFGSLNKLSTIPDFSHLKKLEYLVLSLLHSVSTIPSLEKLKALRRLNLIDMIQVTTLPSVSNLHHLNTFALTSRNPVCCNGFVYGFCDLTHFSCLDRTAQGEPLVQCTAERMTSRDYHILITTEGQVCETNQTIDLKNVVPTAASTDEACGGVMFKQCVFHGIPGICYPGRMQPISCQLNAAYTKMRRLQIQRGVGEPCDPTVESWLGCQ